MRGALRGMSRKLMSVRVSSPAVISMTQSDGRSGASVAVPLPSGAPSPADSLRRLLLAGRGGQLTSVQSNNEDATRGVHSDRAGCRIRLPVTARLKELPMDATNEYIHTNAPEPHAIRSRKMLAAHPELRTIMGPTPSSALWIAALVFTQLALTVYAANRPWWIWLPLAYFVGAFLDHGLWGFIHECSHNLVFRSRTANRLMGIFANVPIVVPASISFAKYHMIHHTHMGELALDAGVPGPTEARLIGHSSLAKALWLGLNIFIQGFVRPWRVKVKFMDGWTLFNMAFQVACIAAIWYWVGGGAFKYLMAATAFAIGLHPVGGRWISEHFALEPGQETCSYWGPLNTVAFNLGYHTEHHDIMTIAWSRLPQIPKMAPEFYEGLHVYRSWTQLILRFIFDRNISLYTYVVRP